LEKAVEMSELVGFSPNDTRFKRSFFLRKSAIQVLMPLPQNAHFETKHDNEGEPESQTMTIWASPLLAKKCAVKDVQPSEFR
jgi:hypothetical protein